MHTDRCGDPCRQKCRAKGSGKKVKIQQFRYRDTANVEIEMYDYTSHNWGHQNSNKKLKEKPGSYTRKPFHRFTTADNYTQGRPLSMGHPGQSKQLAPPHPPYIKISKKM
jgi:hypothetical protein